MKFTVKESGEIQKMEMKDAPATPPEMPSTPSTPDTPKTGDDSKPLVWSAIALLGLLLLGVSFALSKKNKYK